jgi:hypothetical protein
MKTGLSIMECGRKIQGTLLGCHIKLLVSFTHLRIPSLHIDAGGDKEILCTRTGLTILVNGSTMCKFRVCMRGSCLPIYTRPFSQSCVCCWV